LDIGSCICRLWELSGLPCRHACAAIFYKELDPSDFISNYYTPAAYYDGMD